MGQPLAIAPITVPIIGNSAAQGTTFQIHLATVTFIAGAAVLAVLYEGLGTRGSARHERLAHGIAHGIESVFAWATTWAVFAIVFLLGLYPGLFAVLVRIFFWPWVAILIIWAVLTVLAYTYYFTWNRLQHRRALHMAIGGTYAASQLAFVALIVSLSSYQLTPGNPRSLSSALLNPTWAAEWTHRFVAVLGYSGFILAGFAAYRLLRPLSQEDRSYWGWVAHQGVLWGVIALLLQPAASGWFYTTQVKNGSPGAFGNMMGMGPTAWYFLVQLGLLFALFFSANVYMWRSMARSGASSKWMRYVPWAIVAYVIFWGVALIPGDEPLGAMFPWKAIALAVLVVATCFILAVYVRSRTLLTWTTGFGVPEIASFSAAALSLGLIIIMGVIREGARGGELIYGVLK